jgi:hypothetical protein
VTAPAMPDQAAGRPVIDLEWGVTVYPPRRQGEPWRAVWVEDGRRRFREAVTEEKLAAKLEKGHRAAAGGRGEHGTARRGPDRALPGPGRLPVQDRWSRKHAHTQRRLCERFAVPVIGAVTCQDITTWHTQQVVSAAPTAGEGDRVHRMISALVTAGIEGGYLTSPRLAMVHWQAGDRPLPAPKVTVAGEPALLVDASEIPSSDDIGALGRALAARTHGEQDELMANLAAYSAPFGSTSSGRPCRDRGSVVGASGVPAAGSPAFRSRFAASAIAWTVLIPYCSLGLL